MKIISLLIATTLVQPVLAASMGPAGSSFNEVRERVFAQPLSQLPNRKGITPATMLATMFTGRGKLVSRSKSTFAVSDDFKAPADKLFHPRGVCLDGVWEVNAPSGATGLLAQGTRVNAIVRISSGDDKSDYRPGQSRIMGVAVKLFPTQDPNARVVTRNILMLDNAGLEGSERVSLFGSGDGSEVYYTNVLHPKSAIAKAVSKFLGRFDLDPSMRPVYPLTETAADGFPVVNAVTPTELRLIPEVKNWNAHIAKDLRTEVLEHEEGDIAFKIAILEPSGASRVVGTLRLGSAVISDSCDLELHYAHAPNRQ